MDAGQIFTAIALITDKKTYLETDGETFLAQEKQIKNQTIGDKIVFYGLGLFC